MTSKEIANHFGHIEAAIEAAETPEDLAKLRDAASLLARYAFHKIKLAEARIAEDAEEIEINKRAIESITGLLIDRLGAMENE